MAETTCSPTERIASFPGKRRCIHSDHSGAGQEQSLSASPFTFRIAAFAALVALMLFTCFAPAPALAATNLPEKFDLRERGVVSPVKNQDPWGTCWAFAATAASETSIMSELGSTYQSMQLDFSPRHLGWFASSKLPDAKTMSSTPSLAPYASQAEEGMTVLPSSENPYAHPLEAGGLPFYAAEMFASGSGPVSMASAPYKNDEDIAEYAFNEDDEVAILDPGQTLSEFLAQHPGVYHRYAERMAAESDAADGTQDAGDQNGAEGSGDDGEDDDDAGEPTTTPLQGCVKVTDELAKSSLLSRYAIRPIFDTDGHFIPEAKAGTPIYTWSIADSKRFSRMYDLEAYRALPLPTTGYEGQPYAYNEAATEAIKHELMAGRAVCATIFDDSATRADDDGYSRYTNRNTWSQYTVDFDGKNTVQGAAHQVCIVGWDDSWGQEKFVPGSIEADEGKVSRTPPHAGAWIIKNSYGAEGSGFPNEGIVGYLDENGKHTGYLYLSYYDMALTSPASFDFDVSGHVSDLINQYDLMPAPVPYAEKSDSETLFANVFTASQDQSVHALSVECELPNTHARLELRLLNSSATNPADGTLLAVAEKDLEYGGLYRLNLEQPQTIKAGQHFSVVARLTAEDDSGTVYQVPVHRDVNESSIEKYGNKVTAYVTAVVNEGESFLYRNGAWEDWKDCIEKGKEDGTLVTYYDYDNFPLKAYADVVDAGAADASAGAKAPAEGSGKTAADAGGKTAASAGGKTAASAGGKVGKSYKVTGNTYKVASNAKRTVVFTKAKCAKTVKVPASVKINKRTYKVVAVGAKAFRSARTKLAKVVIGKNVKRIGASAFSGCKKLRTLQLATKSLTKKRVSRSLVGSRIKTVKLKLGKATLNKTYASKYAKIFTKNNCGKAVVVK